MTHAWRLAARRLLAAVALSTAPLGAQPLDAPQDTPPPATLPAPTDSAAIARGETHEVSLLTMAWGEEIWARFGHNAIRVRDRRSGFDMSYNWGMFDFDQPNFLSRFLTGDTKYWMAAFPSTPMLEAYARQGRAVREQRLDLRAGERGALLAFLEWNALEPNRYYRYDYYRDNCSTRVRDALDRVLGGALARALDPIATTGTWRSHTERLTAGVPLAYAGISIALGRNADRPLSTWQEAFLPVRFARALDSLRITRADGTAARLVTEAQVLVPATRPAEPEVAPRWSWWKSLATAAIVWLAVWLVARGRGIGAALTGVWYLLCGVLGTALFLAGTVTKHVPYMGTNASLLLVNPLHLVLAVLVPLAVWRLARGESALIVWTRRLAIVSAVLAMASPLAFAALGQSVLPVGALGPLHLIGPVALGVGRRRSPPTRA
ncbi:MAG: DUF4105 domain-containing protein [Gemmatimonadaceae bacterium]|nr:DUF4105 domain-containing protein [Gemmatimonadaceae bacterium]